MTDIKELELLVATRPPLVLVETTEVSRVEELFRRLTVRTGRPLYRWALATGLQALEPPNASIAPCRKPVELLQHILMMKVPGLYLTLDLHRLYDDPVILSHLHEIA